MPLDERRTFPPPPHAMSAPNLSGPTRLMQMLLDDFVPEQASAFLVLLRAKVRAHPMPALMQALMIISAVMFRVRAKLRTCSMH